MSKETPQALFMTRFEEMRFLDFQYAVSATKTNEVAPALAEVEAAVGRGLHAAGFLTYEAAPGLNPELSTQSNTTDLPSLWFGLYETITEAQPRPLPGKPYRAGPWAAGMRRAEYRDAVEKIRSYLAAGDSYQVNFTFGLTGAFAGSAEDFYQALCRAQQADFSAYLDLGRFQILCQSPELFFSLEGQTLTTRPMKGTRTRSIDPRKDAVLKAELAENSKERAENLMIVDLLRNDMGRISRTGSVEVENLFQVEAYPTLWQMTSTIRSKTSAPVTDIFRALFPCGSVTGAPKRRTMEIIRDLEPHTRGVYCGAVGYWLPGRRARFQVGIRTVTIDSQKAVARYGVGSGITWDSAADAEYDECLLKGAVLDMAEEFELTEALLFDGEYFLLDRHLLRLARSADFFRFSVDLNQVRDALKRAAVAMSAGPQKVRLLVSATGQCRVEHEPALPVKRLKLAVASAPVDETDIFLRHKTTRRNVYDTALAAHPEADDVLLWNTRGEITETCKGNLVADFGAGRRLVTPPLHCGLLPGVMRAELLDRGEITEAVVLKADLPRAQALYMINSVRTRVPIDLLMER